jgi:hypothetical protein
MRQTAVAVLGDGAEEDVVIEDAREVLEVLGFEGEERARREVMRRGEE